MLRISNVKLSPAKKEKYESLKNRLKIKSCKILNVNDSDIVEFEIVKRSIDARKTSDVFLVCTVEIVLKDEIENRIVRNLKKYKNVSIVERIVFNPKLESVSKPLSRPVVIGAGPAGLFCAYILSINGFNPIVIERGKKVEDRKIDVDQFWAGNKLNPNSNVQFGEGGAGTFSDGKLNTQIKDKTGKIDFVLKTFIENGANPEIAYEQKPHVGTDVLVDVVRNLRNKIIENGGEFRFSTCFRDIDLIDGKINKISLDLIEDTSIDENKEEIKSYDIELDDLILCIGHSSRDTLYMLHDRKVDMEAKSFAVGYRVMHDQLDIDKSQYGDFYDYFGAAPYKLTYTDANKRGVFSFCDCPGGYVVNASSEPGRLAINGMSYSDRASNVSNSAIIVQVNPEDFSDNNYELAGIEFQRSIEEKAFKAGNGNVPVQYFGDFLKNSKSSLFNDANICIKGKYEFTNLRGVMPEFVENTFIEGMHNFSGKINGFANNDVLIAGVESRTTSPVRIIRDDNYCSNIEGIYPCGEGAGYAGGITSAAVDGIKVALAVMNKYGKEDC